MRIISLIPINTDDEKTIIDELVRTFSVQLGNLKNIFGKGNKKNLGGFFKEIKSTVEGKEKLNE